MGNKTECALLEMAYKFGYDFRKVRDSNNDKLKKKYPFNSTRKRMSVIVNFKSNNTDFRIYTKGAPDVILEKCSHYIDAKGK